ncbi:MAG: class I SAM-dependent methyltransferase, partial [Burkholderiales bacterium]|nr:class I SAM-dependent methyltransferase [Burkholderiales bacterium]
GQASQCEWETRRIVHIMTTRSLNEKPGHDRYPHHAPCRAAAGPPVRRGRRGRDRPERHGRRTAARRARAPHAQQDRVPRLLHAPEGPAAARLARHRRAAVHARAQHRRARDRRVRHVVRPVDAAPGRGAARQRRGRPPGHLRVREGDALQTLARDLPGAIDLVLLDGAKALYPEILALLEPRLRPGALVIADNADHSPDYLARVRAADGGYLSTPFGDDVEVSMRLG